MKKILLAAAATSVLASSSAFAEMNGEFYGTLYGGANKLNKVGNFKSETVGHIGVGVGYYINEMLRADLTFDHLFEPEFKGTQTVAGNKFDTKISADINALMLNTYADLFDAGMAKFYVGGGVGVARTSLKVKVTNTATKESVSGKLKNENSFAYSLHLGASAEFAPGVNGFLQYSWKDYDAGADASKVGGVRYKRELRGHHGSVGVRVDF